jgi:hypothetical protein
VPDRVVFDHVIAALVHGSGYERLASPGCSDRTIRRRLSERAHAGLGQELLRIGLDAYDRMIAPGPCRPSPSTGRSRNHPAAVIGPLPDQPCLHPDRGYDSAKARDLLDILGYNADIAIKGTPAQQWSQVCGRGVRCSRKTWPWQRRRQTRSWV